MKKGLLFLMLALAGLFGGSFDVFAAEKTTSPFTGITIEQAAGRTDLYLYNVESGYWLQENNRQRGSWNTRGNLDAHGFDVAIKAIDGGYQIDPKFGHNNSMNSSNWYLDTGDAVTAWTFNSITKEGVNNAYQIKSGDNWLHATPEDDGFMLICNDRELRATWQIVTLQERIDYLTENATEDNPVDATFLIKAFNLANEDSRMSAWTQEMDGGNSDWNRADDGNDGYRCLRAHGFWNSKTSSYTQTIANVPDGIYEFYCTGFYRDGKRDECQERRSAGTETIRGFMFINNERAPLKSILDGAQQSSGNGFGYHNESYSYGYFPDGGDDVTRAFVSTPDAYLNEPVRATVAGGTMNVGIVKTEYTGGGDWVFFSRFRLRYLGPAGLSGYLDALNSAISSAEAFSGETTDVLASNLASALSAARALVDSRDTDAISAATGALNDALNAAHAVDVTVLSATIALAQTEGIDVTAANTVVEEATTVDAVNTALENLRTARRLNAVDKQPDIFTGSAPEDEGQYYIYNVGAQRYLTGGVDYGTHAAVNFAAQVATFTQSGDGWRIHTNIRTGSDALNHNGFVDCGGDGDTWYLIEVSTGVYNISQTNSNTGANLLGYSGGRRGNWWQVDSDNQGADQAINQWKLVTKEERDALMANASPTNPIDATYYIHAAGLDHYLPDAQMAFPLTSWQTWFPEGKGGNNGIGGWETDFNWESWNSGNIKFYQELTGLTPGKYRLTAQAYYRHGNFEQAVSEFNNPKTDGAILYATNGNGVTAQSYIVPITSEVDKVPGYGRSSSVGSFPDDRNETAAQFFEAGLYKNVVNDIVVTADGTLTIGVEKFENNQDSEWVVADNFRLTYLGPTSESITVTSAGYATYCSYHALDFTSTDIKAYVGTKNGDKLTFTPINQVPANTGLLLVYNGEKTEDVPVIASASAVENNCLVGVNEETTINSNDYILNVVNGGAGFYKAGSFTTLGAHKAYIPAAVGNGVKGFTIDFEDDATGIKTLSDSPLKGENIYNLAGQRLSKTQKGINIVNGKKILK